MEISFLLLNFSFLFVGCKQMHVHTVLHKLNSKERVTGGVMHFCAECM